MTINTNAVSLNAQRNLGLSGNSLSTTMQRLSSGLRVNSAKDDAAGLAISQRMAAQSSGLNVAARNANDGISLAQTAEGALGKIGDMLQRQRELAVQASNATNSDTDRAALQSELSQLTSEIDRVAKTTSFNGQKLLDGAFSGSVFQVGANSGDNITVGTLTKATANGLGDVKFGSTSSVSINAANIKDFDKALSGMSMEVGGKTVALNDVKAAASGEARLGQMVSAINEKTADTGVTAFLAKGAKDGEFTISLKSSSEGAVLLKGFDSLAGEPAPAVKSKLDFSAMESAVGGYNNLKNAVNAKAVVEALDAQIKNASGYKADGTVEAGSVAEKMQAVSTQLKTIVDVDAATPAFKAGKSATDFDNELSTLTANAWTKADTAALNPAATSKLDFENVTSAVTAYGTTDSEANAKAVIEALDAQVKLATGYNAASPADSTGVAKELNAVLTALKGQMNADMSAFTTNAGAFTAALGSKLDPATLAEVVEQDTYATNGPANPSQLRFTATEDALDDFAVSKSVGDAKKVVDALQAQVANAQGYDAVTPANSTGIAKELQAKIVELEKAFTDGTMSAFGGNGANGFVNALKEQGISLDGLTSIKAADGKALNPGADGVELQAAVDTVMKLDGESAVADVNKALKELNVLREQNGQEAFDELAVDAKPANVEAALKDIQGKLDTLGLNIGGTEVTKHKGIDSVNISTQAGAWEAIKQIDSAIDQVNSARGDLGALQTRFEKTVENIDIQNENISAAKGRIVDADFATETANLSRAQILQQAGTAMVAQANQLPQQVLSLLR
ncbi:flagellin [Comamonas aquatica]|nr:flagellin [Comamonas aquatica]MDH0370892.1 flagellin [Comamonas aquatica]